MNITQVIVGKSYRIVRLNCEPKFIEILAQRGLYKGARIEPLCKNKNSVLLHVLDTVFLLTQDYQKMIEVVEN